ncbi:MAG: DUF1735 domain-containing protein [Bacteroidales bacterium]|nr:DUF1735 domain-containing protein [Bacteroidales bacterium]
MKRISLIFAAVAAIALTSCTKEVKEDLTSYYRVYADTPEIQGFAEETTQTISVYARTADAGLNVPLTIKFAVDESLLDLYNASKDESEKAKIFPSSLMTWTNDTGSIREMYRISSKATIKIEHNAEILEGETWYVIPVVISSIEGSSLAHIAEDNVKFIPIKTAKAGVGSGTADKPYLIRTPEDFCAVTSMTLPAASIDAVPTYFKLLEDIDMTGVDWKPVNDAGDCNLKIDFNGNGHTISNIRYSGASSYPSIFGVAFGEFYDLTIDNASIATGGPAAGIFAAEGYYAKIHGITVTNSVLDGTNCGNTGVGGLVGKMTYTEIYACSVDAEVSSPKNYVGGICGWMKSESSIHDCITSGKVTGIGGAQRFAGILGGNIGKAGIVSNCISTAEIETGICAAGIVGHMNEDASSAKSKLGNQVIGCIAWNPRVVANKCRVNQYSSGGVVGYTAPDNILKNNWRRTDMVFTQNVGMDDPQYPVNYTVLEDQEDADEEHPLDVPGDHSTSHEFYYHGKAAAAGETASQVARRIGWDETIWDLSGDVPALKK